MNILTGLNKDNQPRKQLIDRVPYLMSARWTLSKVEVTCNPNADRKSFWVAALIGFLPSSTIIFTVFSFYNTMGRLRTKGKAGAAKAYVTRSSAVKRLQCSLADFRRLCILKGKVIVSFSCSIAHDPDHEQESSPASPGIRKKQIKGLRPRRLSTMPKILHISRTSLFSRNSENTRHSQRNCPGH